VVLAVCRSIAWFSRPSYQDAINWLPAKGALPIPGAKNAARARENAGAVGWRLTMDESNELEASCPR
jgi:diketogulonate reductase-like aldo/keto reductase